MRKFRRLLVVMSACVLLFPTMVHADLQRGDTGDAVLWTQQMLIGTGWLFEEADGIFGGRTEQAVMDYQAYKGLEPTGIVDNALMGMLSADMTLLDYQIAVENGEEYWNEGENTDPEDPTYYENSGSDDGSDETDSAANGSSSSYTFDYEVDGGGSESNGVADSEDHCYVMNVSSNLTEYVYCEKHAELIAQAEDLLIDSVDPSEGAALLEEEVISLFNEWMIALSDDSEGIDNVKSAVGAVTHAIDMQTALFGYWYGSAVEPSFKMEMLKREMVYLCESMEMFGQGGEN